jgi:hypothetical protein
MAQTARGGWKRAARRNVMTKAPTTMKVRRRRIRSLLTLTSSAGTGRRVREELQV